MIAEAASRALRALARRFSSKHLRGHELVELQLGEMNTFLQSRKRQTWVFSSIDVWSRLWPAALIGSCTYRNTQRFVRSVAGASRGGGTPLITTDGFKFYAPTIRHVFGLGCVLAQVIKKIKRNRVAARWLPPPRLTHPLPTDRFYAKHPR